MEGPRGAIRRDGDRRWAGGGDYRRGGPGIALAGMAMTAAGWMATGAVMALVLGLVLVVAGGAMRGSGDTWHHA
jgi:hypothetical protein